MVDGGGGGGGGGGDSGACSRRQLRRMQAVAKELLFSIHKDTHTFWQAIRFTLSA